MPRWGARIQALDAHLALHPEIIVVDPLDRVQQVGVSCVCWLPLRAALMLRVPIFYCCAGMLQVLDREGLAHLLSGLNSVHIPGGRQLRAPASITVSRLSPSVSACPRIRAF